METTAQIRRPTFGHITKISFVVVTGSVLSNHTKVIVFNLIDLRFAYLGFPLE